MEELIGRIVENVGIDEDVAKNAVGLMLGFLKNEGAADKVEAMMSAVPGVADAIEAAGGESVSGSVMALGGKLMGAGLGMGDIQGVAKETISFAKEKVGESDIDEMVSSIPGLSQFI